MVLSFSLLSFNVYSGPFSSESSNIARYRHQLVEIRRLNPDIVCLQEYNTGEVEYIYKSEMERMGFRCCVGRRSMSNILRSALLSSVMLVHHGVRKYSLGTQDSGLCVWWKQAAFEVIGHESVPFDVVGSDPLTFIRPRGFLSVNLRHKPTNKQIHVVNTHLNLRSEKDRSEQSQQLLQYIHENSHSIPTIVAGDFNTVNEKEDAIHVFVKENAFLDFFEGTGPTYYLDTPDVDWFGTLQGSDKRCDFILGKGLRPSDRVIIPGRQLRTDHEALLVRIREQHML